MDALRRPGAHFQRLKDVSPPCPPPGTHDLRSVNPLSLLKPPQWLLGLKSLDMKEGRKKEEGTGHLEEQVILLQ